MMKEKEGKFVLRFLSLITVPVMNFKFINTDVEFVLFGDIHLKSPGNN